MIAPSCRSFGRPLAAGLLFVPLATVALGAQALPGIPVWRLGPESRFPGLAYVVFPGQPDA